MESPQKVIFEISTKSVLKIVIFILGLMFLYLIRDVLLLFFVVLIIVAALNPIVNKWQSEIPRRLAIVLLFVVIILGFIVAGLLVLPPLISQLQKLALDIPNLVSKLSPFLHPSGNISSESQRMLLSFSSQLSNVGRDILSVLGKNLLNTTIGFAGGLVAAFTVLVSSFYLMSDEQNIKKAFLALPIEKKEQLANIVNKIGVKMGGWLRGQLLLMLIVGSLDFIGLLIFRINFPLTLGVWSGLTEVIPYIGPILGGIPAVIIAFLQSPWQGLAILIWFVIVQQIEAQFLVPKIMGKAVGLSPVIIIFAILIGSKLMGVLGVLLAIPAAAAISVFIQEYPNLKK